MSFTRMHFRSIARCCVLCMTASIVFCFSGNPVVASTNIVTNPGAESDGTGWTTILNGGDGMSYTFDSLVRSGSKSFQTSHGLDSISQTVDLFAHGYTTSSMSDVPPLVFSVWVASRGDQAARYYVKFSLLRQDGVSVVSSADFGTSSSLVSLNAGTDWTEITYTFRNYGAGARYAYIEFGGTDQSGWAGNYGAHFDDASISEYVAPVVADSGGGGATMPAWGYVPPKGPFSLTVHDHPSATVQTTNVVLDLSASSDVDRMALSRYTDFHDSGIVPIASSVPWSVCGTPICHPGTYDVYAKFYQAYGLSSPVQHLALTYAPEETASVNLQTASASGVVSAPVAVAPSVEAVSRVLFERDLRQGDRGADVKRLQQFLNAHGYVVAERGSGSPGNETIVFGPALRRALTRFQETNTEKLLMPLGLKKGTGVFGSRTRMLVNEIKGR